MIKRILSIFTLLFFTMGCLAQEVNDNDIVNRVQQALNNNAELEGADISIFSVNGYVLLAGQVLTPQQRQEASVTTAFAVNSIRRLINELDVVATLDNSFEEDDQTILEQISAVIPEMSPATLPVIHDGVVHLLGRVTRKEGNEVATAISKMRGVKNIRLSYEFKD